MRPLTLPSKVDRRRKVLGLSGAPFGNDDLSNAEWPFVCACEILIGLVNFQFRTRSSASQWQPVGNKRVRQSVNRGVYQHDMIELTHVPQCACHVENEL